MIFLSVNFYKVAQLTCKTIITSKSTSINAAFIDESSSVIVLLTYQHHPPILGFSKCGQSAFLNQNLLRFKNCSKHLKFDNKKLKTFQHNMNQTYFLVGSKIYMSLVYGNFELVYVKLSIHRYLSL